MSRVVVYVQMQCITRQKGKEAFQRGCYPASVYPEWTLAVNITSLRLLIFSCFMGELVHRSISVSCQLLKGDAAGVIRSLSNILLSASTRNEAFIIIISIIIVTSSIVSMYYSISGQRSHKMFSPSVLCFKVLILM